MKRTDFLRGLRNSMPIVLGYMPVCLTFGAVGVGMQLDRMLIMSLSVLLYAGAGQFAAIQLFSAGAGALITIATVILINLRYALLAESFKSRRQVQSFFSKIVVGPLLTEEVYAVAMYGENKTTSPQSTAYILGLQIPPYVATAVFTATGISAGSIIPTDVLPAVTSALYGLLIFLVLPHVISNRLVAMTSATAAVSSTILTPLLGATFSLIAAAVLAALAFEVGKRTTRDLEGHEEDADDAHLSPEGGEVG